MKYLKLFEDVKKYKVGDYVKIKIIPNYVIALDNTDEKNLFTRIEEIDTMFVSDETYRFVTSEGKMVIGNIYLIKRKMTPKEIEEYIMREESNKYNL